MGNTVRKEWLEDLVVAETMKLIQDDAVIDAIVAEVMELQEQENDRLTADCSTAELFKHFRMLVYITMQIHLLQPFF